MGQNIRFSSLIRPNMNEPTLEQKTCSIPDCMDYIQKALEVQGLDNADWKPFTIDGLKRNIDHLELIMNHAATKEECNKFNGLNEQVEAAKVFLESLNIEDVK